MQKVIVVSSKNVTPDEEIETRIAPLLKVGYRVISATTTMMAFGEIDTLAFPNSPRHIFFATTLILEK